MHPSQFKALTEVLRAQLRAINEAIQEQTNTAVREQTADREEKQNAIGTLRSISDNIQTGNQQAEARGNQASGQQERLITAQSRLVIWAALAFFAAFGYGLVALWQGYETRTLVKTAQDTYTAIDRPYVGIDSVDRDFLKVDDHGNVIDLGGNAKGAQAVHFRIGTKNYGSVPAEKFSSDSNMTIGDKRVPGFYPAKTPGELFPGQTVFFVVGVGQSSIDDVVSGRKRMRLFVHLTYQYAGKSYEYCEKQEYETAPRASLISAGVDWPPGWDK